MLASWAVIALMGFQLVSSAQEASPDSPIAALKQQHAALAAANTAHSRALHSYLLNDAADRYAEELNTRYFRAETPGYDWRIIKRRTEADVQQANQYGAAIVWCEFNANWTTRSDGYLAYLSDWPNGPDAEEAWWRGKLLYKSDSCTDSVGSEEETRDFIHDYSAFLKRFPQGRHAEEARKLLKNFQKDLDAYKSGSSSQPR